jgi:glycosyltransferase involved in cell wall biosynthesis
MDNHPKISAILIVYHEEALIERCLQSLTKYVDEIIVIHDGPCQDNTLTIAQKYTSHIHEGDRKGMMEFHLIDAIKMSSHDWVLRVDADEFLSPEMGRNLHTLIQNTQTNSFTFIWPIWDGNKYITQKWPYKPVLFRKSSIIYIEDAHSNFMVPQPENTKTPYTLEHQPLYNNYSWKSIFSKQKRFALIHAKYTRIPLSQKRVYNFDISQVNILYLLTHRQFALRYSIRRHIPEILLAESIVFFLYYILSIITHNTGKTYYYKVQFCYKILYYLALRNIIREKN